MASNIVSDAPKKRRKTQTQHVKYSPTGRFADDQVRAMQGDYHQSSAAENAAYMDDDKWTSGNHRPKKPKISMKDKKKIRAQYDAYFE